MRNLKKVLALVIAFSMMLSVVAFAGYNDVDADADYASAVELLSALNIFKGDENGNFNPDNTITRAEMAAIICRAKGLEDQAAGSAGATMFADVAADHWASGYINLASQNGIINGYGDGNFGPDDTVTYEQAIKMLVCTLGYEPMAQAKGGWSTGYLVVANTYKLTEGAAANATRANLAILVANALEIPMMDQTAFGTDEKFERLNKEDNYTTLLTTMDIYVLTGSVAIDQNDKAKVTVTATADSDDFEFKKYVPANQQTNTPASGFSKNIYVGETDIAAYEHQIVNVYVKKDARKDYTALAVVDANVGQTISIVSDDIFNIVPATAGDPTTQAKEVEYFIDPANSDDEDSIDIAIDTLVYNKQQATNYNPAATVNAINGALRAPDRMLTFIDVDGDDKYTTVIITEYTSCRVESVEADKDKIGFNSRLYTLDFENKKNTIIIRDMAGNALTLADLAEDDMIAYCANDSNIREATYLEIVKLDNAAVTGKVESTWTTSNGVAYVSIDGNEYVNATNKNIASGDEGTYYIGMTGKIVDFEATSAVGNYGIVLEAGESASAFGSTWQIKILTAADGVVTYELDEKFAKTDANNNQIPDIEEQLAAIGAGDAPNAWNAQTKKLSWARASLNSSRLVEFETNSKGLIDELNAANGGSTQVHSYDQQGNVVLSEYKANTQKIDGKTLEDDVIVFCLDKANADDVYATDLNYLVDEAGYQGYVFKDNIDKENCVMVVTGGQSPFKAENGFAVVTKKAKSQNAEGDEVYTISYVQAEEAGVITFTDDSEDDYGVGKTYEQLGVGDVILFNADGEGLVTNYAIVAQYGDDPATQNVVETGFRQGTAWGKFDGVTLGEDAYIHTGYLYHFEKGAKASTIYIAADNNMTAANEVVAYELPVAAYKYTYNNYNPNNIKIAAGEYLDTVNTEFWTNRDTTVSARGVATPVIFVEIEGAIVDIYSTNATDAVTFLNVPGVTGVNTLTVKDAQGNDVVINNAQ